MSFGPIIPNSIALTPSAAYAGQLAEPGMPYFARSANCEGTGVSAGMPVKRGTNKARQVKPFGSSDAITAQSLAGFVMLETSRSFESAPPLDGDQVAVLREGSMFLNFSAAVTAGQNVAMTMADNSLQGVDVGAALASGQQLVPGARVVQTTTAAGLAICEISIASGLAPAGTYRRVIGPFVRDNVAASLTSSRAAVGATAAPQVDLPAPRAGSVVGITASLTVAPAGSNPVISVFLNGSLLNAACILTITAGSAVSFVVTFASGVYNFAAGDRLGIAITTDGSWTATTSDLAVEIEIEC